MLARRDDGLVISDDPARLDLVRICAWPAASYRADDRDRATIERSSAGSRPFGEYDESADAHFGGGQLALTRATTDGASELDLRPNRPRPEDVSVPSRSAVTGG